jgi:plastocyanin
MKKSSARSWFILAAVLTSAVLLPIVVASRDRAASPAQREIRLVVKGMTFYLEGHGAPNPTLRVQAGEQIRLVLRNEDPGMYHDWAIERWQVQTPLLEKNGEVGVVSFRVPDLAGTETYTCTPHPEMMRGTIDIR